MQNASAAYLFLFADICYGRFMLHSSYAYHDELLAGPKKSTELYVGSALSTSS